MGRLCVHRRVDTDVAGKANVGSFDVATWCVQRRMAVYAGDCNYSGATRWTACRRLPPRPEMVGGLCFNLALPTAAERRSKRMVSGGPGLWR